VLLFLKEKQAEEVKIGFPKAKQINAFSFLIGEDFNFFIATNLAIDLYDVKISKQKTKLIKNITLPINDGVIYYEPMVNFVLICDLKGSCYPFFLNLYK
jgi:hypothetical protein